MYVKFEFTQEDLVDASKRFLRRQTLKQPRGWKNSLILAVGLAVIVFFFLRNTPGIGVLISLVVGGIVFLIDPYLQRAGVEGRLRRIVEDIMSAPGPFLCEVEIRSDGLWLRQMEKQIIHEWPSIEVVEETVDSVDLFTHDGGGVVVRNRAFASEDERSKFIALARSYLIQARS